MRREEEEEEVDEGEEIGLFDSDSLGSVAVLDVCLAGGS